MSRKPGSKEMLAVARSESEADISIIGGKVFSPSTKEWIETGLAIKNGFIVGWGEHDAHEIIDVKGAYIAPGFIDSYASIETCKLWIDSFVDTVLPHGTTAVAADPFQLTNIFGIRSIEELVNTSEKLPFTFGFYASSDAPPTLYDSTGEHASAVEIAQSLRDYGAIGVGGLHNATGVINGEDDTLAKIASARGLRVMGSAPLVTGASLDAYLSAGVDSDGSSLSYDEALEKLQKGMWLFLRNGTIRNNMADLLPLAIKYGTRNLALSTDERELETIVSEGHLNASIRYAVEFGLAPEDALVMASTNPALFHGFTNLGYLSPGYQADIVILPDLYTFQPSMVFQRGRLVARSGKTMAFSVPKLTPPPWMLENAPIDLTKIGSDTFSFPHANGQVNSIIVVDPNSYLVRSVEKSFDTESSSISRLAALGKKGQGKDVAMGLVEGFGLTEGAIATTLARGPHSLMAIGSTSEGGTSDMAFAVSTLIQMGGGQVVVKNKQVISSVSLPIGGILSTKNASELVEEFSAINLAAQNLGITLSHPFRRLELLALMVMGELRITNLGSVNILNLVNQDPMQSIQGSSSK